MCPSLIEMGQRRPRKTAQTKKQTNKQTDRQTDGHYENNGHLAVDQKNVVYIYGTNLIAYHRCRKTFSDIMCVNCGALYHSLMSGARRLRNCLLDRQSISPFPAGVMCPAYISACTDNVRVGVSTPDSPAYVVLTDFTRK